MVKPVFDFSHLTIAERIQLAQDLWDSIADAPEILELTEAQRTELDRRLARHTVPIPATPFLGRPSGRS